ncbi:hypothetical protein [Streptomyces sp. ST2-7A]|uniref:hypothetical protein n=1 Tax=Streptomyces sp. ST2-7A TaxID=2907214 RepID=UPI001F25D807|nr:hypothetical protein [Streptomyces sp. ST2-7A]MCE7081530.1 hypothetical protein [Streptomyces sp. ST2-7A]
MNTRSRMIVVLLVGSLLGLLLLAEACERGVPEPGPGGDIFDAAPGPAPARG